MNSPEWKKYLFWFANEHVDFRCAEIKSILRIFGIPVNWMDKPTDHVSVFLVVDCFCIFCLFLFSFPQPYWIVELPSENAACQIASRSVSLRCCLELWAQARTKDDLHRNIKTLPSEVFKPYFKPELSFKINVETFCNRQTQAEKMEKIESFSYLPLEGPVKLSNPDVRLEYIEYYGLDSNNVPEKPLDLFFGRWIADGQRELLKKLSLKTRKFIGNTSMDPQLSLFMANQALVQKGDLILDPFVGSGSLLVAAAQFGGYVLGSDINYLMLHGKSRPSRIQNTKKKREKDESVLSNMQQYGCASQYLDVVVADMAMSVWSHNLVLDAIITDPPYGIREATERIGSLRDYTISNRHLEGHIPSKVEYTLQQIYADLLCFAAQHLKLGGRLVCWVPIVREAYHDEDLPAHPCFELVANSEQVLTTCTSRRLVTLEKIEEPKDSASGSSAPVTAAEFRAKFFRYGEELRKQKKQRKMAALAAYKAAKEKGICKEGIEWHCSTSER